MTKSPNIFDVNQYVQKKFEDFVIFQWPSQNIGTLIRPQPENGRGNCPPPPPFFQPALQKNRTVVCSGVAPERVADEAFLILDMVIPLGSSGMFFVSLTCPFVAACK